MARTAEIETPQHRVPRIIVPFPDSPWSLPHEGESEDDATFFSGPLSTPEPSENEEDHVFHPRLLFEPDNFHNHDRCRMLHFLMSLRYSEHSMYERVLFRDYMTPLFIALMTYSLDTTEDLVVTWPRSVVHDLWAMDSHLVTLLFAQSRNQLKSMLLLRYLFRISPADFGAIMTRLENERSSWNREMLAFGFCYLPAPRSLHEHSPLSLLEFSQDE